MLRSCSRYGPARQHTPTDVHVVTDDPYNPCGSMHVYSIPLTAGVLKPCFNTRTSGESPEARLPKQTCTLISRLKRTHVFLLLPREWERGHRTGPERPGTHAHIPGLARASIAAAIHASDWPATELPNSRLAFVPASRHHQVFLYGSVNSTVRSLYDSTSPRFWALGAGKPMRSNAALRICASGGCMCEGPSTSTFTAADAAVQRRVPIPGALSCFWPRPSLPRTEVES